MSRSSAKETILDAAEAVVSEQGAVHLTLDAVAQRAEVSKGGLLYHFPSKEALLQSMLMRLCDRFDERRADVGGGAEGGLGPFVQAAFDYMRDQRRVSAAIFAAVANDPKLLDPIRERRAEEMKRLGGSVREIARGLVVMLAVDGLWYSEMLEMMNLTEDMRQAVLAELMELAERAEEEVER